MGILRGDDQDARRREQNEVNRRNAAHSTGLADQQNPFDESGQMQADYVEMMVGSDLTQGTVNVLSNLTAKDFALANLDEAETWEFRWLARELLVEVDAMHPPEESVFQGEFRKFCADKERQALKPLDDVQRATLFQFVQGAIADATKGEDMRQQEELGKTRRVSETIDHGKEERQGWLSRD
jgi:hypothetical protein